jgi:uncharacterized membrane protein
MNSRSFIVFLSVALIAAVFVFSTVDQLPETVATHYEMGGRANGWMSRTGYLLFTMVFLLGFSTLVSVLIAFLPRKLPRLTNIPNRDYWLAEARRQDSLRFLSSHGWWLGCLIVLLSSSIHYAILEAHRSQPPSLPLVVFLPALGGFLFGVLLWIVMLYRRFPKKEQDV